MASIETIGIEFDTSGLQRGQRALSDTERAANSMATSIDRAGNATITAGTSVKQLIDRQKAVNTELATGTSMANAQTSAMLRMAGATDAQVKEYRQLIEAQNRLNTSTTQTVGLLGQMKSALAGLAIAAAALQAIKMADAYTMLNSRLKLVTNGATELVDVQGKLYRSSQASGTLVSSSTELYIGLARATKELGTSQGNLLTITDTFGKAIAISGGSTASASAAITQFNQAMASGVLRGEEFNSMSEQAPRIMDVLSTSLGKTKGELRALAHDGKLTSDIVLPALVVGAAAVSKEFGEMPKTISQAMAIATNSFTKFLGEIDKATGATAGLAKGIIFVAENGATMAKIVGVVAVGAMTAYALSIATAATATGVLAAISGVATTAIVALRTAIMVLGGPITIAVGLMASFVAYLNFFGDANERAAKKAKETAKATSDAAKASADEAQAKSDLEKAMKKLNGTSDAFLSKEEQKADAMQKLNREYFKAKIGVIDNSKALQLENAYKEKAAEIDQKYATKKTEATKAIDKQTEAHASAMESIKNATDALKIEIITGDKATASQKKRAELDYAIANARIKLTDAQKDAQYTAIAELRTQEEIIEGKKAIEESNKRAAAGLADYTKIEKAYTDQVEKSLKAATEEAEKNEDLVRTFGKLKGSIEALELARLEEQLAQRSSVGMTMDEITALEKLIDAKKRNAAAVTQLGVLEGQKKVNDALIADNKRMADSIESTLTDALMRGFEKGKSFGQNLVDTLKNMFNTLVLRPTIQGIMAPISTAMGSILSPGVAQAAGSTASGGESVVGAASSAMSIWTSTSDTLAKSIQAGFDKLGLSMSGGAPGTAAQFLGSAGSTLAGYGIGSSLNTAISGEFKTGSGVQTVEKIATAVASFIWGPVGGAIAGAISGLVNRAFGMGDKKATGQGITGQFGGEGFTGGQSFQTWTQQGGWFRSDKSGTDTKALDVGVSKQLNDSYNAIRAATAGFADQLGLPVDAIKNYSMQLNLAMTGDATKDQQAIVDMLMGIGNAMATSLVPSIAALATEGESASATLQRVATNYAALDAMLNTIGDSFGAVGVDSLAARERLISLSGGMQQLAENIDSFAQNFLTEAERMKPIADSVTSSLAAMGLSWVDTRDEFKDVALAADKTTEAGAKQFAQLMELQGAFAMVYPQIDATIETVDKFAEAAQKAADDLSKVNAGFESQIESLLRARMSESELRAAETIGMDASTIALYDRVNALKSEDESIAAGLKARESATAAQAKILSDDIAAVAAYEQKRLAERAAIAEQYALKETTLYNLMHSEADQLTRSRQMELAAIDATLRPIQEQIYAQQDLSAAASKAADEIQAAAQRAAAVASQRASIERNILQFQGDTVALRALELAALDPANRALQESLFAMQDKKAADEQAAQAAKAFAAAQQRAAEESARAAEQLKKAWQSATDSIFDEVNRIRGLVMGGGTQAYATAQASFAVASAQTMAGDQEAAKLLPGLSKSMLDLAEVNAATAFDLRLIRAQTAASLARTGSSIGAQFGLSVPSYDVGTPYVPATGLALIHEGEAIVPKAYNPAAGGKSSQAQSDELAEQVRQLREENKAQARAMVALQLRMARMLEKWDGDGLPEERSVAV